MNLLCPPRPESNGRYQHITPAFAGWRYVGFSAWSILAGESCTLPAVDEEQCLVILSGIAEVKVNHQSIGQLGQRMSVFEDTAPAAVYIAPQQALALSAHTELEFALCSAPSQGNHATRIIDPASMARETRGQGTNTRHVRNILPEDQPADSLLVVEVRTPSGHWSSYPPHKHDTDAIPHETFLEETYYHRLNPSQGFCFQRVYTDDASLDETMSVTDRAVVLVPKGYHPVGVPHGYESYYLNVMAGPTRQWIFKNHPDHAWIVA